ncbi:MAG TPA: nitrile hydratase subunit beta [Acidimicrobiales bacterium]|nr:nitrile hydratase subunit beta [Acidimicrobiales bacterium]
MDGIHDLGGAEGFGPVEVEPAEPVFHEGWERRALGLTMASFVIGLNNGGQFRHSIERMDPAHYLTSRYYEHWVTGVATRLVETQRVDRDELDRLAGGPFPLSRPSRPDQPQAPARAGGGEAAMFAVGDVVRVRSWHPTGHTRCPRYTRGRVGVVVRVDPPASVPDVEAHFDRHRSEPVYCVRFEAGELWGEEQEGATVHVDLWQSYLEAA